MATQLHQRIAAEVRAEMGRQDVSQGQLAERLGTHQTAVSRKLTGRFEFTVKDIEAYAAALGVPVDQLLGAPERAA